MVNYEQPLVEALTKEHDSVNDSPGGSRDLSGGIGSLSSCEDHHFCPIVRKCRVDKGTEIIDSVKLR